MAHFYLTPPGTRLIAGETIALTGDEAKHAAKAARLRVGERVLVGDGAGTIAQTEAISVDPSDVQLVVLSHEFTEPDRPALWLIQSLAKSGRDEQAIEAATEVGVAGVVPLAAKRCVSQWRGDKAVSGQARWQRIVTEASKQSIQAHTPTVAPLRTVEQIAAEASSWQLLVLDHRAPTRLADLSFTPTSEAPPIGVMVGPEGGFDPQELELLEQAGATPVRLGSGVMRTSTAGPIALALIHQQLGHW